MSKKHKLELINVYKEYPLKNGTTFEALNNLSMQIKEGEFVSIIGPSGSGKSTLFNIISGLETPTSGDIYLDGESIINTRGHVGYMPQNDYLLPWRTIIDNVILGMEIKGFNKKEAREKASNYLDIFGLEAFKNEYPSSLSGGMKQRASLLRTVLLENDVLLLDEPFGALDEITRLQMQDWLLSIWQKLEHTILFVTHSIDEAVFLSDRVFVFSNRPARIKCQLEIDLPRERNSTIMTEKQFTDIKKELLFQLNN